MGTRRGLPPSLRRKLAAIAAAPVEDARYRALKARLEEEREKLREQFATLKRDTQERLAEPMDIEEQAVTDARRSTAAQELEFLTDMAHQVDAALQALRDGTYGRCVGCGQDIPENRLRAQPFADRCIGCAQLAEDETKDDGRRATNRGLFAHLR